jgi:D-3-phosphoglycerate dehydrogenase
MVGSSNRMKFDVVSVPTFMWPDYKVSRPQLEEIANIDTVNAYDEGPLLERVKNADGLLLLAHIPLTAKTISRMTKCKGIVQVSVGFNNVDLKAAGEKGIVVSNIPDYCIGEVADSTLGMMLALTRKIMVCDRAMKKGTWDWRISMPAMRLNGKTIGIIGFGRIGRAVAVRVKALGMNILEYDPYIRPGDEKPFGAEAVDLETLLATSDVISLHVNLTPETTHLLGETQLKKMKKTAYLIDTCRGSVVDLTALYRALNEGWIAGAAFDVFENEPPDLSHKLFQLGNFISTPHMAYYSEESVEEREQKANDEMVRILKGAKPKYQVNSEYFGHLR